ncbi:MAG: hypothetical protein OEW75_02605 [Cyclobacteriaceae bacterium]|nr:hypothetical protein [Cyclobacteriaceae bacterium]
MALSLLNTIEIIETMENFVEAKRPPEEVRSQIDIGYEIDGQSIYIFEIRPAFMKPTEKIHTSTLLEECSNMY